MKTKDIFRNHLERQRADRFRPIRSHPQIRGSARPHRRESTPGHQALRRRRVNCVQENLIRGGLSGISQGKTHRKLVTRPVNSIGEDVRLNKALWDLTEKMKELKMSA